MKNGFKNFLQKIKYGIKTILDITIGQPVIIRLQTKYNPYYCNKKTQQIKSGDFRSEFDPDVQNSILLLKDLLLKLKNVENCCLIFSPAPFESFNGQRNVRIAQELVRKNFFVVFVRCLPNDFPISCELIGKSIFHIGINWYYPAFKQYAEILNGYFKNKLVLFELTFDESLEISKFHKDLHWKIIYDIIDDWEEFSKKKYWDHYTKSIESDLVKNADAVVSINEECSRKFIPIREIPTVANGYSPEILGPVESNYRNKYILKRKNIIIGTFGYLHIFRFNWELMIEVAKQKPEWTFQIIGFGEMKYLYKPKNIQLLGSCQSEDLYQHAKYWNAAIIPYYDNDLCNNLNPIKIFEFLYFQLPIVIHGCKSVKDYPYTFFSNTISDFISNIEMASRLVTENQKINDFLKNKTWEDRTNTILNQANYIDEKEKLLLQRY